MACSKNGNYFKVIYFGGGKRERERNINVWLPFMWPPLGTWPETQACALIGN